MLQHRNCIVYILSLGITLSQSVGRGFGFMLQKKSFSIEFLVSKILPTLVLDHQILINFAKVITSTPPPTFISILLFWIRKI